MNKPQINPSEHDHKAYIELMRHLPVHNQKVDKEIESAIELSGTIQELLNKYKTQNNNGYRY
jgi:hypothetical protein